MENLRKSCSKESSIKCRNVEFYSNSENIFDFIMFAFSENI